MLIWKLMNILLSNKDTDKLIYFLKKYFFLYN